MMNERVNEQTNECFYVPISSSKPQDCQVLVLTPVILATQEAEIRRIKVQSQPRKIVCETLS
jgi:hypothetical protein